MFFFKYLGIICLFPFIYCFIIYPMVLVILGGVFFTRKKNEKIAFLQKFSFILPAYNEEKYILGKLRNLKDLSSNLPVEILVGNDGSTDQTLKVLTLFKQENPLFNLKIISSEKNQGKWNMLKRLIEESSGDILVMSDISGFLPKNILNKAGETLMDDDVAVYSPTYKFSPFAEKKIWEKIYWPYERLLKKFEDRFYSTSGAHGACYFIRKTFLPDFNSLEINGVAPINDDFLIPTMAAILHKKRIVYDEQTAVMENESTVIDKVEYKKRLRIAQGNYLMGEFLWHKKNQMNKKLLFVIFSHKILRSYIAPGLIIGSLMLSLVNYFWLFPLILSFLISPMRASFHALLLNSFGRKQVSWA